MKKEVIVPLFDKSGLEIKTVLKWKLSALLHQQFNQNFPLNSTITEDEETVIVSIEVNHDSKEIEQIITNLVGRSLGLEKVKGKKGRI
jgi:hypothetical protein